MHRPLSSSSIDDTKTVFSESDVLTWSIPTVRPVTLAFKFHPSRHSRGERALGLDDLTLHALLKVVRYVVHVLYEFSVGSY